MKKTSIFAFSGILSIFWLTGSAASAAGADPGFVFNVNALINLLVFIAMVPLTFLATSWAWTLVCKAANKTVDGVGNYYSKRSVFTPKGKELYNYLLETAPSPSRLKKWYIIHILLNVPVRVSVILALIGCFTRALDTAIQWLGMINLAVIVLWGFKALYDIIFPD